MKIIHSNLKKQEVKLSVQNQDDLWYLSHMIEPDDIVRGKTFRKIKLGGEEDRKAQIITKPATLSIRVEKQEFSEDVLRVSGKIVDAPDDISKGNYHTFNLEVNSIITLIKQAWLRYHLDKLKEASQQKITKTLVCVLDRDEATFALLKKYGYSILSEFKGNVQKKAVETKSKNDFYQEIISKLTEYVARYGILNIILASPAFFKEDLVKEINSPELKKKIILATCNNVGKNGIDEVLKRPEVKQVLVQDRLSKEMRLVEELLDGISKNDLAVYGIKQTKGAIEAGAVKTLLITDDLIKKSRDRNNYATIDYLMKLVDSMKGDITIISSEHEGGKKLDGLGGIAAILRYKLNY